MNRNSPRSFYGSEEILESLLIVFGAWPSDKFANDSVNSLILVVGKTKGYMRTITINILNEKAINLLKELESLDLIKMLTPSEHLPSPKRKPSDYKGVIPTELNEPMQEGIKKSREEWQNRT